MRESLSQWTQRMQEKHPEVDIQVIKQYSGGVGGVVGCFAWENKRHIGSWPSYLLPGYQMLSPVYDNLPVCDDPCDNWEPSWYRGHDPLLAGVER